MAHIKKLYNSWFGPISISAIIYIVLFIILSLITIVIPSQNASIIIESLPVETPQDITLEIVESDITDENITVIQQSSGTDISAPSMPDNNISISNPDLLLDSVSTQSLPSFVDTDNLNAIFNIGQQTIQDTSVSGVLDRLTVEILNRATDNNINVIWLFDASISLSQQRKNISSRFGKILQEINQAESVSGHIAHTIASFGKTLNILSDKPSQDRHTLVSLIDSISIDDSGIENIFGSIDNLNNTYKEYKNIIIVFTDEVGDDIDMLENTIVNIRKSSTVVYIVGPPAPFGISKTQFRYKDPDPQFDQTEKWVEINQGPETCVKMTLDLHTLPIDESALDSGYGPYALSRLCINSGGIYFSMHPNRDKKFLSKKDVEPLSSYISVFFDAETMRKYPPDYRNLLIQKKDMQTNRIQNALINACNIPINIAQDQTMNFTANTEGEFVEQLSKAQRFSALIEPKLDQIYDILKSVESSAQSLKDPRWLASYNLAIGRICATKCRIELYNNMLAEAKSGLKKTDPKNNIWTLEYSDNFITKNSQLSKIYDSANKYLKLVVDNFPNTPWSLVAEAELNTAMGYKWVDSYKEVQKDKMGANNNNPNAPRKDDVRRILQPKPIRKIDKI